MTMLHSERDSRATRIGYLDIRREKHFAIVTMDRAEKLNAMTAEFWADLRNALDLLASEHTRVVIITGAGDRAFSAGGDISSFTRLKTIDDMRAYQQDAMSAFSHVEHCPLTAIAAVNGLAYGGGCELAMACDIVIATDTATFALPEANLGLVPGFGVLRAPDIVGRQMAKLMIASGEPISAQRAYEIGLVQRVVPRSSLLDDARSLAMQIAERSPHALAVSKRMINSTMDQATFAYSVAEVTELQASRDRAEGVAAFLERRKPVFGPR